MQYICKVVLIISQSHLHCIQSYYCHLSLTIRVSRPLSRLELLHLRYSCQSASSHSLCSLVALAPLPFACGLRLPFAAGNSSCFATTPLVSLVPAVSPRPFGSNVLTSSQVSGDSPLITS